VNEGLHRTLDPVKPLKFAKKKVKKGNRIYRFEPKILPKLASRQLQMIDIAFKPRGIHESVLKETNYGKFENCSWQIQIFFILIC
jgi:hypothetical protein